jgi:hypothetical protein
MSSAGRRALALNMVEDRDRLHVPSVSDAQGGRRPDLGCLVGRPGGGRTDAAASTRIAMLTHGIGNPTPAPFRSESLMNSRYLVRIDRTVRGRTFSRLTAACDYGPQLEMSRTRPLEVEAQRG